MMLGQQVARGPINLKSKNLFKSMFRCVLLGDSITNNCYQEYASGQFGIAAAGYFAHASNYLYGALRLVAELGVPGETSEQILARAQSAVNDYYPDIVIVLAGTNDFTNANISADTTVNNLEAIARIVTQSGALCVMLTIPPKDTGLDGTVNAFATKQAYINYGIQYKIGQLPGVVIADSYTPTVDIADGTWVSSYTTDGTHPLANAAHRMGIAVGNALKPFVPDLYHANANPSHQLDGWNLVYNAMMTGNNAAGTNGWTVNTGVTGNGPSGYNGARLVGSPTGVCSKVSETATLMKREWTRIACTFAVDSDCLIVRSDVNQNNTYTTGAKTLGTYVRPTVANGYAYRCIVAGTASAEPTWPTTYGQTVVDNTVTWQCVPLIAEGVRFVGVAEYKLSSVVGNVSPMVQCSCRDNGGAVVADMVGNRRATADVIPDAYVTQGVIWTPEFLCPANVNRIQLNVGLYGSAGGSANFDVTGMGLYVVPSGWEVQKLLSSN